MDEHYICVVRCSFGFTPVKLLMESVNDSGSVPAHGRHAGFKKKKERKHRQPGEFSAMTFSKVLDMLVWLAYLILRGGFIRLRAEPSHFIGVVGSGAEERRTPAEIQPRSRRS